MDLKGRSISTKIWLRISSSILRLTGSESISRSERLMQSTFTSLVLATMVSCDCISRVNSSDWLKRAKLASPILSLICLKTCLKWEGMASYCSSESCASSSCVDLVNKESLRSMSRAMLSRLGMSFCDCLWVSYLSKCTWRSLCSDCSNLSTRDWSNRERAQNV